MKEFPKGVHVRTRDPASHDAECTNKFAARRCESEPANANADMCTSEPEQSALNRHQRQTLTGTAFRISIWAAPAMHAGGGIGGWRSGLDSLSFEPAPHRHALAPIIAAALTAGSVQAFALFFDEAIVTIFTAGQQTTLPIWMLGELVRPRQRPVTNVVAVLVIALTLVPILVAYRVTRGTETTAGGGK